MGGGTSSGCVGGGGGDRDDDSDDFLDPTTSILSFFAVAVWSPMPLGCPFGFSGLMVGLLGCCDTPGCSWSSVLTTSASLLVLINIPRISGAFWGVPQLTLPAYAANKTPEVYVPLVLSVLCTKKDRRARAVKDATPALCLGGRGGFGLLLSLIPIHLYENYLILTLQK